MTSLVPLQFDNADFRMVVQNGVPWWVGIDVTAALGIVKGHQALAALEDYERGTYIVGTPSGDQEMIVINESGFYSLLFRSRKPIAAQFKRWLTTEVLPSIRKFGAYPPPIALETSDLPALQPVHATEASTPTLRFFEEVDRMAAVMDTASAKLLGVLTSVQTIRMMRLHGEGLDSILKKADKVRQMASAGFDMPYILRGERTMTREERGLIAQLREVDSPQRAAAFKLFSTQLPALAIPPVVEIEEV